MEIVVVETYNIYHRYYMAYKTFFFPTNKNKYVGDPQHILCRSLWERRFCKYLDENIKILKWGFETIKIPYLSPIDNKVHYYIPDFIIETENADKIKDITVIEIKPNKQTKEPTPRRKKNNRAFIQECSTYSINISKWNTASDYCIKRGWKFKILTEKDLF